MKLTKLTSFLIGLLLLFLLTGPGPSASSSASSSGSSKSAARFIYQQKGTDEKTESNAAAHDGTGIEDAEDDSDSDVALNLAGPSIQRLAAGPLKRWKNRSTNFRVRQRIRLSLD